jgi:hypothetical protein
MVHRMPWWRSALVLAAASLVISVTVVIGIFALSALQSPREWQEVVRPAGASALWGAGAAFVGGAPYYLGRGKAPVIVLWTASFIATLALAFVAVRMSGAIAGAYSSLPFAVNAAAVLVCVSSVCAIPCAESIIRRVENRTSE